MNRTILSTAQGLRSFDFVSFEHDVLIALAQLAADLIGSTSTALGGFAATPDAPADLSINLAAGSIYQLAEADATTDGAIVIDTTMILQQGLAAAQKVTLTAPTTAGQSQWNLIQAQFSQVDQVRPNDPNGGVVPFYNSANPNSPNFNSVNTERAGTVVIQVIKGAAATTGSEVPPTPTSGFVPLYLVDLAFGQTQITSGEILTAGPSVGTNVPSNYPAAPFLVGLAELVSDLNTANALIGDYQKLAGKQLSTTTAQWTVEGLIAGTVLSGQVIKGTSLTLNFNGATTGANSMDTGSMPTSGDLHVYAIYNPTTTTWACLGTTSGSGATIYPGANMPAGYTASCKIASLKTNGSAQFNTWFQLGHAIYVQNMSALTGGSALSATAVSISGLVPADAKTVSGSAVTTSSSTTMSVGGDSSMDGAFSTLTVSTIQGYAFSGLGMATAQTIYYEMGNSSGTGSIFISSYTF